MISTPLSAGSHGVKAIDASITGLLKAGEAFWEPGGDVIHYQDANNRTDIPLRFIVTMMMTPDHKVLVFADDDELKQSVWTRRS